MIGVWGSEYFSSPPCPDCLWGPPSHLFKSCQVLFPWEQSGRDVKLTTHLHIVPRSRLHGTIPPFPNTPSGRGAKLKHRDVFTFNFIPRFHKTYHLCRYRVNALGSIPGKKWDFFPPRFPDRLWGLSSLLSKGYWAAFHRGVTRLERETDHSPPSSAVVMKAWSYTSTPSIRFHCMMLS
jgi:hypothetical protein